MSDPSPEFMPQTTTFARVRSLLVARPFKPFRIVTTSGRGYEVPTADHAGTVPLLRMIHVALDDGGEVDIPALHVSSIETGRRLRKAA